MEKSYTSWFKLYAKCNMCECAILECAYVICSNNKLLIFELEA